MARKQKSKSLMLNSKTVRNTAIALTAATVIGGTASLFRGCHNHMSLEEQQAEELRKMHENEMHRVDSLLDIKYKITDRASFDRLYKDALPLIQLSMFSTEVLVKEAYADAGGRPLNTRGLGSYWVPENGDPKSSKWILTSEYLKKHPEDKSITGDQALDLSDGWYSYREDGRILRTMFKKLQGCELTVNEFAAIATCYYNNEKRGKNFCEFVHDNYKSPIKCAAWLIPCEGIEGFGGITKRATHEACVYLNPRNYISQIGDHRVKKIPNSNTYVTSVTQLTEQECLDVGQALRNGNTKPLNAVANRINRYVCKGGKSVAQIICENVADDDRRKGLLLFTDQSIDFLRQLADNKYKAAIAAYNDEKYEEALAGFQEILAGGYDGADLHNDLAVTYYHLGRYEESIEECRYILYQTGETEEFAHAYYNAGRAAEALNQPKRAYDNYKLALQREKSNPFYKKLVMRLQKELNITNEPIEDMINPKPKAQPASKKQSSTKATSTRTPSKQKQSVAPNKNAPKKKASRPAATTKKNTPQKKPSSRRGRNSR